MVMCSGFNTYYKSSESLKTPRYVVMLCYVFIHHASFSSGFVGLGIRPSPSSFTIDFGPLERRYKCEILGNILNCPLPLFRMSGSATGFCSLTHARYATFCFKSSSWYVIHAFV